MRDIMESGAVIAYRIMKSLLYSLTTLSGVTVSYHYLLLNALTSFL